MGKRFSQISLGDGPPQITKSSTSGQLIFEISGIRGQRPSAHPKVTTMFLILTSLHRSALIIKSQDACIRNMKQSRVYIKSTILTTSSKSGIVQSSLKNWHNYSSHTTTIDFKSTTSGSTMNFFYLHMANDSFE